MLPTKRNTTLLHPDASMGPIIEDVTSQKKGVH